MKCFADMSVMGFSVATSSIRRGETSVPCTLIAGYRCYNELHYKYSTRHLQPRLSFSLEELGGPLSARKERAVHEHVTHTVSIDCYVHAMRIRNLNSTLRRVIERFSIAMPLLDAPELPLARSAAVLIQFGCKS